MVTAERKLQIINECSNPNPFFAVRGGGGGSRGVITQVTYKAYPTVRMAFVFGNMTNFDLADDAAEVPIERLTNVAPFLED